MPNLFQKILLKNDSNLYGSLASALCLLHCILTPFIFVAHAEHVTHSHSHPFW